MAAGVAKKNKRKEEQKVSIRKFFPPFVHRFPLSS
jgi:ribosomal protein L33